MRAASLAAPAVGSAALGEAARFEEEVPAASARARIFRRPGERFENPEGTMLGAPVRHAELAAPPKKPPKDEV